jgi:peroxiredoxin
MVQESELETIAEPKAPFEEIRNLLERVGLDLTKEEREQARISSLEKMDRLTSKVRLPFRSALAACSLRRISRHRAIARLPTAKHADADALGFRFLATIWTGVPIPFPTKVHVFCGADGFTTALVYGGCRIYLCTYFEDGSQILTSPRSSSQPNTKRLMSTGDFAADYAQHIKAVVGAVESKGVRPLYRADVETIRAGWKVSYLYHFPEWLAGLTLLSALWLSFFCLMIIGSFFYLPFMAQEASESLPERLTQAPPFSLPDIAEETHELTGFSGKPTLLYFWAPWCGPCKSQSRALSRYHNDNHQDLDIVGVAVSYSSEEAVRNYVTEKELPYVNLLGSDEVGRDYKVSALPSLVLLDAEGIVRDTHAGGLQGRHLQDFVDERRPIPSKFSD